MKKIILILIGITGMLIFSGCASDIPMAPVAKDKQAKAFKTDKKYANIYLYVNTFTGVSNNLAVLVDNKYAGSLKSYSYFLLKLKPGQHHIVLNSMNGPAKTTINVKSNRNYFIEYEVSMRNDTVKLTLKNAAIGQKGTLNTKLVKSEFSSRSYANPKVNLKATYISPAKYKNYSCRKLSNSVLKLNSQIKASSVALSNKKNTQAMYALAGAAVNVSSLATSSSTSYKISNSGLNTTVTPYTTYLYTPVYIPSASSSSKDISKNLQILLGHYDAMKAVAQEKKCNFTSKLN